MAANLHWFRKWDKVLDGTMPNTKWFVGGKTQRVVQLPRSAPRNLAQEQGSHHLGRRAGRQPRAALPGPASRSLPLRERAQEAGDQERRPRHHLHADDSRAGDRHAGLRRIGATHSIIFGGFSADAISDRNNDAQSKLVITADGGWRRGKEVPLKQTVDESLEKSSTIQKTVVVRRTGSNVNMVPDRDYWWHELMAGTSAECDAAELDSEHPLYLLYTSGSTGKPKGILHTTAGYLLGTLMSARWVFDLKDEDTYWCTADVGWVTGHSYIVYGPPPAPRSSCTKVLRTGLMNGFPMEPGGRRLCTIRPIEEG